MSVDRLKRIFSKTILDSDQSSTMNSVSSVVESDQGPAAAKPSAPLPNSGPAASADPPELGMQVTLPVLGVRTEAQHQQILLTGIGVALVALVAVALYALTQSERSGPQIGVTVLVAGALALLCALGLVSLQRRGGHNRQSVADGQMLDAERLQHDAKRVNDANQAAILRLMNELQTVAEGDLTQQATVTEDITGAIADSVNYTVEELRTLVANVQNTASRVAQTTSEVDLTSTELLAASNEQMNEIQAAGRSVLDMATRINQVSSQAQESAAVARQSLQAAESGLQAVQNAIGGMNSIRDQIQDTSKRI